MTMGYIMSLTRTKATPVLSRSGPMMWVFITATTASTNWNLSGVLTYPYFPYATERLMWTCGTWCWIFFFDRANMWLSELEALNPIPPCVNTGCLLAFLFHPWGIVGIAVIPGLSDASPFMSTGLVVLFFIAVAWLLPSKKSSKPQSEAH